MKKIFLAASAVSVILSQTACSDGGSSAAAQYAAANNCSIAGVTTTAATTAAGQAAASQVPPCSFQNVSQALSSTNVASSQVNTGAANNVTVASLSGTSLNQAVQMQNTKVQSALAAIKENDSVAIKAASVEPIASEASRAPSSIGTPVSVESSAGFGEASR